MTAWMELESIMLSERSQAVKVKYHRTRGEGAVGYWGKKGNGYQGTWKGPMDKANGDWIECGK